MVGKILKRRPNAAMNTPYDRPTQPLTSALQPQSPSWLSELVLFAKFIAGGATKILLPIWNPNAWASSSSSSSEDGVEVHYEDNENPSDGFVELNQKKRSSFGKSEMLHLIAQLLMREQFSREEYARLVGIIESRVDAGPSIFGEELTMISLISAAKQSWKQKKGLRKRKLDQLQVVRKTKFKPDKYQVN